MLVMVAGSIMNFILAILLFFIVSFSIGHDEMNVIGVISNSPASNAGIETGDRITHVNKSRVRILDELSFRLRMSGGNSVLISVLRGNESLTMNVLPEQVADQYYIGVLTESKIGYWRPSVEGFDHVTLGSASKDAVYQFWYSARTPFIALAALMNPGANTELAKDITLTGPIGLASSLNEVYTMAAQYDKLVLIMALLLFAAHISAAIGVMNLLPIPALDGSRLYFLLLEAIRKKALPPEREAVIHGLGMLALLVIMLIVTVGDISRVF